MKLDLGLRARPLRVLIADDLKSNRTIVERLMAELGHVAYSVADGAEAVAAVAREHFDLVLMDVLMPGVDGLEATRRIRTMPGPIRDVPIVALTVATDAKVVQDVYAARMNVLVAKPLTAEKFQDALARLGLAGQSRG